MYWNGKARYNHSASVEKLRNNYAHLTEYCVKIIIESCFGRKIVRVNVAWLFFRSFHDNFNIWNYYLNLNLNQHKSEIKISNEKEKLLTLAGKEFSFTFRKLLKENYNWNENWGKLRENLIRLKFIEILRKAVEKIDFMNTFDERYDKLIKIDRFID